MTPRRHGRQRKDEITQRPAASGLGPTDYGLPMQELVRTPSGHRAAVNGQRDGRAGQGQQQQHSMLFNTPCQGRIA